MLAPRTALVVGLACALLGIAASPAAATISINSFTETPSTTAAGASPTLKTHIRLNPSPNFDDARNLTVSLAPGLLADLKAVPGRCSSAQLSADSCPANSQIGTGSLDALLQGCCEFFAVPARLYLVEPTSGELARMGLVANIFGTKIVSQGPVSVRTSPAVGLDVAFQNLPRTIGSPGAPIEVHKVDLSINGTVRGRRFTRNPTACAPGASKLTAVSYAGDTKTASSAFTPTACSALSYSPSLTASAAIGSLLSAAVTTTVTQGAGQAATKGLELKFPPTIAPRISTLLKACVASNPAGCPASSTIGTVTADIGVLPKPLVGRLVLRKGSLLPGLAIVFPDPLPLVLNGKTGIALDTGGVTTTFPSIPDVPISRLEVKLTGGSGSLFTAPGACLKRSSVEGNFTGHNGKTAKRIAALAVTGCKFLSPLAKVSLKGLASGIPRLSAIVRAPSGSGAKTGAIQRISLTLPKGLAVNKKRLSRRLGLKLDGSKVKGKRRASRRVLKLALPSSGKRLAVTLKGKALKVSRSIRRKLRAHRKVRLKFTVKVRYKGDGLFTLKPRARAR